jgi:NADH-quinone oxidoreductase subunit D
VRVAQPYSSYDDFDFNVPENQEIPRSCFAQVWESISIIRQALQKNARRK